MSKAAPGSGSEPHGQPKALGSRPQNLPGKSKDPALQTEAVRVLSPNFILQSPGLPWTPVLS